jgi:hypothetical protein
MADIDQTAEPQAQPRWTRLASLGLVFVGLGPLVIFLGALAWGLDTGDAGFFAVVAVVGLIGAFLVWRFGTWSKILGIVLGVGLGGLMFWTAFSLFAPQSFFDFVPGMLILPGAILAIASCIGAIVAGRRGHRSAVPEGGERRGIRIALSAAAVLALLSGVLTLTSKSTVVDASSASVRVDMKDFKFTHRQYSVGGGSIALVKNADPFQHSFTVDALGIDDNFTLGTSKLITIPAKPGTYILYCKYHTSNPKHPSKDDMAATLTIT